MKTVPRLAQLTLITTSGGQKIEIIKTVAPDWKNIGTLLDFDANGNTLSRLQANNNDVDSCCRYMFHYWLQGNGIQPATWATLVKILEDCNFNELAAQITTTFT